MNIRVVVLEPTCEGNVGSIARAMKNFGLSELFLVKPKIKLVSKTTKAYAAHAHEILEKTIIKDRLKETLIGVNRVVATTALSAKRQGNVRRSSITCEELAKMENTSKIDITRQLAKDLRKIIRK